MIELLGVLALAVTLKIGPELVMPMEPAHGINGQVAVAPIADDAFVAVWSDGSGGRARIIHPDFNISSDFSLGLPDDARMPVMASHGFNALSIWTTSAGLQPVYIYLAGGSISPPPILTEPPAVPPAIAADRDHYLVAWVERDGIAGQLLDFSGNAFGNRFTIARGRYRGAAAASSGRGWLVAGEGLDRVDALHVDADGHVSSAVSFPAAMPANVAAAWDGGVYLAGWTSENAARIAALADDGSLRKAPAAIAPGALSTLIGTGNGAVALLDPARVVRFAPGGVVAEGPRPLDIGLRRFAGAAFANGKFLIAQASQVTAVFTDLDKLAVPISFTAEYRFSYNPRLASNDTMVFAGWIERDGFRIVARVARIVDERVVGIVTIPDVQDLQLDVSGDRAAVATQDADGSLSLYSLDAFGNLTKSRFHRPAPPQPSFFTLGAVVIAGDDTAVVWSDWGPPITLHAGYASGLEFDLGPIRGRSSFDAAYDGEAVLVSYNNAALGTAVTRLDRRGARDTIAFGNIVNNYFDPPSISADRHGHVAVATGDALVVLDQPARSFRVRKGTFSSDGDVAWDGGQIVMSRVGSLGIFDVDGNPLDTIGSGSPSDHPPRLARGALAYIQGGMVVRRIRR